MSLPSVAEVEHADWPSLKRMCESLGLNPKGRSAVVRMRVLDHVRRRARPEPWRARREHVAALLARLGFPELSEDAWRSTIQLDAPTPWVGLGQAQLAGGFLLEAAKSFDRAVQMGEAVALLHRAEAFAASGGYDRAINACELYLGKHPGDLRASAMKADFLARAGFTEEAVHVLEAAAESHPEVPGLPRAAGTAFLRAGRAEAALDAFREAIRADPADVDARINQGASFLLLGRTREAMESLREALKSNSSRAEVLNNLGVAYHQMGQAKTAAANIKRAASLLESPQIRLNFAKVRESAGKERTATRRELRPPSGKPRASRPRRKPTG